MLYSAEQMAQRRTRKTDRLKIVQLGDRWWTWVRLSADNRRVATTIASWRRQDEAEKMAKLANPGIAIDVS